MTPLSESKTLPSHPVEVDEMAFAIALFVAAANGKVATSNVRTSDYFLTGGAEGHSDRLLLGARATLREEDERVSDEVPLARAVSIIWQHYELDTRQQAICARLVAFYSLMVRTRGALLGPWMEDSDRDPQSVILAPAIVEAVATAPIGESGQFGDADFRALVQSLAERKGALPTPVLSVRKKNQTARNTVAPLPVSEVVKQLSLHLFAFQACVTGMHDGQSPFRFRVIEQLSAQIAIISGNASLQTMLSRALLANLSNYPWLESVKASNTGILEGIDLVQPPPHLNEAIGCELAILGSFIELLRLFLGNAVTLQILRSLWPLANLDSVSI